MLGWEEKLAYINEIKLLILTPDSEREVELVV